MTIYGGGWFYDRKGKYSRKEIYNELMTKEIFFTDYTDDYTTKNAQNVLNLLKQAKAGDIIYKIDDEEVYAESTDSIASKLRGAAGTTVKLTVVRDGEEKSFTLTRETINNVSAYVDYDGSTAIITVTRFDSDTGTIVQKIVNEEFSKKGVKKVILDLRSNGGGYVSAAKDLLSLWIDGDPVLIQKSRNFSNTTTFADRGQAKLANIPTVVLVNESTASASEIVAGALKDYEKATIIGKTTFGKGVVQTLLDLSHGSMLKVTTARWYTPDGNTINGEGIAPDVEVDLTYDDANHGRDPQLDAAKKYEQKQPSHAYRGIIAT